jgi:Calcineurin-like phosphoesterase
MKNTLLRLCLAFGLVGFMPALQAQQSFSFVALGDLPYGSPEKAFGPYRALIDRINQVGPDFSIHVGDFKSGSTLCSDEEFAHQREHFQRFKGALVFTPGDNEWTDCHRSNNGGYDPLERLAALRKGFFKPGQSLGSQPMRVQSQAQRMPAYAAYVENLRWQHQGVQFNTVHIVGSNNNLEARDAAASREFYERDAANIAWIQSAFADAASQNPSLIVFAFQADVFDSKSIYEDFPSWSGFRQSIGETLLPLAQRWGKPVLVIHGDSHKFKLDQPFSLNRQTLSNITRLIVPGASDVRAVKVTVQPNAALTFELISPAP